VASTETPLRFSHNSGPTSRGDHRGLMRLVQEPEPERRDRERSWDVHIAEAVALLISAHASLENLSRESFPDPRAATLIASVCGNVFEALSTLDDVSVTEWIKGEFTAGAARSLASLPTWWECLTDPARTT
jgi:hypothetical protein